MHAIEQRYNLAVAEEKAGCIMALEEEMHRLAENLQFEEAARLRDEIARLRSPKGEKAAAVTEQKKDAPYKPRLGRPRRK